MQYCCIINILYLCCVTWYEKFSKRPYVETMIYQSLGLKDARPLFKNQEKPFDPINHGLEIASNFLILL